jgi:hypothetical protein
VRSIIAAIRATYIPDEGFTPDVAKRASPAAEGLCKWVHAMSSYDKVGLNGCTACCMCLVYGTKHGAVGTEVVLLRAALLPAESVIGEERLMWSARNRLPSWGVRFMLGARMGLPGPIHGQSGRPR